MLTKRILDPSHSRYKDHCIIGDSENLFATDLANPSYMTSRVTAMHLMINIRMFRTSEQSIPRRKGKFKTAGGLILE